LNIKIESKFDLNNIDNISKIKEG